MSRRSGGGHARRERPIAKTSSSLIPVCTTPTASTTSTRKLSLCRRLRHGSDRDRDRKTVQSAAYFVMTSSSVRSDVRTWMSGKSLNVHDSIDNCCRPVRCRIDLGSWASPEHDSSSLISTESRPISGNSLSASKWRVSSCNACSPQDTCSVCSVKRDLIMSKET
jgi:hypothetical protein